MTDDGQSPGAGSENLTRIFADMGAGREGAGEALLPLVYEELRAMARARMQAERGEHTLQATALVHEAYLRLAGETPVTWENRAHFFTAAARAMQRILVEHARARGRAKRGGDRARLPLDVIDLAVEATEEDVLAVQDAIERLGVRDPRMADIVRLRFYAGLSVDETVGTLDLSERTVRREWSLARAWLSRELRE